MKNYKKKSIELRGFPIPGYLVIPYFIHLTRERRSDLFIMAKLEMAKKNPLVKSKKPFSMLYNSCFLSNLRV